MKKFFFAVVSILFLCGIVAAQHKSRVSFNEGWKFKLDSVQSYIDEAVSDASWRSVNLPHDWSIEGKFDPNNPA